MSASHPWLALILALTLFTALVLGRSRRQRWPTNAWGLAISVLLLFLIAGLKWQPKRPSRLRWIVLDHSQSFRRAFEQLKEPLAQAADDLEETDRVGLIRVSSTAELIIPACSKDQFKARWPSVAAQLEGQFGRQSRLSLGLEAALKLDKKGRNAEILFLSDGHETNGQSLEGAALNAHTQRLPIHCFCPALGPAADSAVLSLSAPKRVDKGADAWAQLTLRTAHEGRYELRMQLINSTGEPALERSEVLQGQAQNHVKRKARLSAKDLESLPEGIYRWRFQLRAKDQELANKDPFPENNTKSQALRLGAARQLLLLEDPERSLKAWLERLSFKVRAMSPESTSKQDFDQALKDCDGVILSDLPFAKIRPVWPSLEHSLNQGSLSLLVLGGPHAFSSGQYAGSPLEALLPVLSKAPGAPKRALALSLAIDASASMRKRYRTAFQAGLREAERMLKPGDWTGILAFSDSLRFHKPLTQDLDLKSLSAELAKLKADGSTQAMLALTQQIQDLSTAPASSVKLALLVTDGQLKLSEAQLTELRSQWAKLGTAKQPARLVFILVSDRQHWRAMQATAEALSQAQCQVQAVFAEDSERALRAVVRSSMAQSRESVARGRFAISNTAQGPLKATPKASSFISAYNRVQAKPKAKIWTQVGVNSETLVASHALGSQQIVVLASTPFGWLNPSLENEHGQRWLQSVIRQMPPREHSPWSWSLEHHGSSLQVTARTEPINDRGQALSFQLYDKDQNSIEAAFLIPQEPGRQSRRLPWRAEAAWLKADGPGAEVIAIESILTQEFQHLEPNEDMLRRISELSQGFRLSSLPSALEPLPAAPPEESLASQQRSLSTLLAFAALFALLLSRLGDQRQALQNSENEA